MAALTTRDVAAAAVAESARKGYLDGRALEGVFTWLRPNDLVWNYFVNNYLLGKAPAGVRRPLLEPGHGPSRGRPSPGLHPHRPRQLVRPPGSARGARAARSTSGRSTSTRTSSPARATTSSRGRARTRARSCSAAASGSCCRGAVTSRRSSTRRARTGPNPSSFRVADELPATPEEFAAQAPQLPGSWWSDWDAWLAERSGALKTAPKRARQRERTRRRERHREPMYLPTDELPDGPGRALVGRSPARDALGARGLAPAR